MQSGDGPTGHWVRAFVAGQRRGGQLSGAADWWRRDERCMTRCAASERAGETLRGAGRRVGRLGESLAGTGMVYANYPARPQPIQVRTRG